MKIRINSASRVHERRLTAAAKPLTEAEREFRASFELGYISVTKVKPKLPKKLKHKVRAREYAWCDAHGAVHPAQRDYYGESYVECDSDNWRRVYIESDDRTETF